MKIENLDIEKFQKNIKMHSDIENLQMLKKLFASIEEKIIKNEIQISNNELTLNFPLSYRYQPMYKRIKDFMKKNNLNSFVYYNEIKETYINGELI